MTAPPPVAPDGTPWQALYAEHEAAMFRLAHYELLSAQRGDTDALDIVQDVFASLIEKPPTTPVGNWKNYLLAATRHRVLDHVKLPEHTKTVLTYAGHDSEPHSTASPSGESAADIAVRRAEGAEMRRLLTSLPDDIPAARVRVLRAKLVEGQTVGAIATELGTSHANVSKLLKLGLADLAQALADRGLDPDVLQDLQRKRQPGGAP